MATKYYGIKDNWTDDDVANVIEVASEDGSVSSVKVNGVEYGGGGGDFSTAEVTVRTEGEGDYNSITAPLIDGNHATGYGEPQDETTVFTVVLYKGTAMAELDILGGENPLIVSGSITVNDRVLTITGDGTVVIS